MARLLLVKLRLGRGPGLRRQDALLSGTVSTRLANQYRPPGSSYSVNPSPR
jgi:hypothetical protein